MVVQGQQQSLVRHVKSLYSLGRERRQVWNQTMNPGILPSTEWYSVA